MQIEESDAQFANARWHMHASLEPGSNVTVESDRHPSKQKLSMDAREEGRQIVESEEQY
jgi:hypothetical protein